MYPPTKTPLLFQDYHLRREQQQGARRRRHSENPKAAAGSGINLTVGRVSSSIGDAYDHLTGTCGGVSGLKRAASTTSTISHSGGGGFQSKLMPIRRPTSLNVR